MEYYYVNKNAQHNGDHEVHKSTCRYLPTYSHLLGLGNFNDCKEAVKEAKKDYPQSNGCYYCCTICHTG